MIDGDTIPDCRWRATSSDDVLWAEWEDDCIAFHRPSGKTHLLNQAGRQLLTSILTEPRSVPEIVSRLAPPESAESAESGESGESGEIDAALAAGLLNMLKRFEQLGLVERA